MSNRRLVHNREDTRYELHIDDTMVGYLDYEFSGPSTVVAHHTWVNDDYEGRGVGSAIVEAAISDFRARQYTVIPQCSFVAAWFNRHPDFADVRG